MPDTKLEALIVQGADLIPLSALLSLPSGFYGGRWIDSDSIAALVEECVRMTPPQAEVQAEPVTDEQIKAAFLANGFTIKEGLTDLKPYVYQAARALLKLTAPQAQPADALDAWQAIGSMPTCDDLIWLYCQDTNTIDGPVAPHPMYEDSWTHWAYAQAPSTATIDAAMAAAQEGGNAAKEA